MKWLSCLFWLNLSLAHDLATLRSILLEVVQPFNPLISNMQLASAAAQKATKLSDSDRFILETILDNFETAAEIDLRATHPDEHIKIKESFLKDIDDLGIRVALFRMLGITLRSKINRGHRFAASVYINKFTDYTLKNRQPSSIDAGRLLTEFILHPTTDGGFVSHESARHYFALFANDKIAFAERSSMLGRYLARYSANIDDREFKALLVGVIREYYSTNAGSLVFDFYVDLVGHGGWDLLLWVGKRHYDLLNREDEVIRVAIVAAEKYGLNLNDLRTTPRFRSFYENNSKLQELYPTWEVMMRSYLRKTCRALWSVFE